MGPRPAYTFMSGFFALTLVFLAGDLSAQTATVRGVVRAVDTGEPVVGATVAIVGTARGSLTNQDGQYRIEVIAPGVYTLRATSIGYAAASRRISLAVGEEVTVDFELAVSAVVLDEIVAVGSRTIRTALETPVPVDIIASAELRDVGEYEVNQMLRTLAPSFNASHQTISDGTDHINPASLRGLGPDQVLVLVNGKRRHSSGLVHVNGTFGRGTVGVDLNAIPSAAIERIEILRDGAAAQYGSDAIAGVINIVLKDQTQNLQVNGLAGVTGEGDGETAKADVNYGFRIGETGFFNVTGDYLDRNRTNRSGAYTGAIFTGDGANDEDSLSVLGLTRNDFSMKTGQGEAVVGGVFFNSVVPLGEAAEFYAFGGLTKRDGLATGFYRLPRQSERQVFEIFANGFLPEIHTEIDDGAISGGVRGTRGGWDLDLSVTHGSNSYQFNIENTVNASLGAASPTTFDAGRQSFSQTTGNFDAVRLIDTNEALQSLSLVLGGEFRVEHFEIKAGEERSYILGTDTLPNGDLKAPGSQVFSGFKPDNQVDRFRNSLSAYAGLESQITNQLLIDVGGRFENYSDFGSTATGKLAARYELTPEFAIRGAVGNGFRAPSLHQIWFNKITTQFLLVSGVQIPVEVFHAAVPSTVARAFGAPPLAEETSFNISAGFTARPLPDLAITADFYRVTIDDRIVLSSRFVAETDEDGNPVDGPVRQILEPFEDLGVTQAQFFTNAVDTETLGVDIVATYATDLGRGRLNLTGSANFTKTDVDKINVPQSIADKFAGGDIEQVRTTIFNREEQNRLETALPRQKGVFSARYGIDRFSVSARANYYGSVKYRPTNPDNDEHFGAKVLFDVDLGYEILPGVRLSAGANNIFNTFPDEHENRVNRDDERFVYSRRVTQFGTNGGFYYGRIQLNL